MQGKTPETGNAIREWPTINSTGDTAGSFMRGIAAVAAGEDRLVYGSNWPVSERFAWERCVARADFGG